MRQYQFHHWASGTAASSHKVVRFLQLTRARSVHLYVCFECGKGKPLTMKACSCPCTSLSRQLCKSHQLDIQGHGCRAKDPKTCFPYVSMQTYSIWGLLGTGIDRIRSTDLDLS